MTPVLGLAVVLGVEVEVVHDAGVGLREVDPQPARLGGQQEHRDGLISVVRLIVQAQLHNTLRQYVEESN